MVLGVMNYFLPIFLMCASATMTQTEENSLLFSAAKKLPSSIVGWKKYLERTYGSEHVSYRTEFKNMPYDVGFLVHIDSPKISLTQWLGIGKDYKKEFPIQIRISDVKILSSLGLLSPDMTFTLMGSSLHSDISIMPPALQIKQGAGIQANCEA
ncbi:MAG: hypothetical protein NXI26_27290 [bacterium]|nr:hypothetical protein [bacterium]